jgi:hypothetical protein
MESTCPNILRVDRLVAKPRGEAALSWPSLVSGAKYGSPRARLTLVVLHRMN